MSDNYVPSKAPPSVGKCGWGCCVPLWLQPLASVKCFIICYFAFSFVHGVQGAYTISMLTTLERRFNLPSSLSGTLAVMSTVGYAVAILFVSHFGRNAHIPRMFSVGVIITSICAFIYTLPHFIFGTGNDIIDSNMVSNDYLNSSNGESATTQFCSNYSQEMPCNSSTQNGVSMNKIAFSMFTASEILHGMAGSTIWSVGLTYLDSNTPPQLASKLIGNGFAKIHS